MVTLAMFGGAHVLHREAALEFFPPIVKVLDVGTSTHDLILSFTWLGDD
jgi:hypothetical protein